MSPVIPASGVAVDNVIVFSLGGPDLKAEVTLIGAIPGMSTVTTMLASTVGGGVGTVAPDCLEAAAVELANATRRAARAWATIMPPYATPQPHCAGS